MDSRAWILEQFPGANSISYVRRLYGGATSSIHAVNVVTKGTTHRLVLKRPLPTDSWWRLAVRNEGAALKVASGAGLAAPKFVARTMRGAPALLMTHLPGRVHLAPHSSRWLEKLAETLVQIHRVAPSRARGVWKYQARPSTDEFAVPSWAQDRRPWLRLFRLRRSEPPQQIVVFCHGDYHPGNVLWRGASISGVVDWQFAVTGPPGLDVAHCRSNLALLEGVAAAEDFLEIYRSLSGRCLEGQHWFDARDALIFSPEPSDVWDWQGFGRPDLKRSLLRRRLLEYVAAIVRPVTLHK